MIGPDDDDEIEWTEADRREMAEVAEGASGVARDSMYQVQVSGPWAGRVGGWRPAIKNSVEESTFATEDAAEESMAQCQDEADDDEIRADNGESDTYFRVLHWSSEP